MEPAVPQIIVFGSLHYDIFVDAPTPPRKGETVAGRSWMPKCGGKGGNQAVAAGRAGAGVAMVGLVGDDPFGQALLDNLDRAGVDRRSVRIEPDAATGMSVAIRDRDGDYGAIIVSGVNLMLSRREAASAGQLFAPGRWLVLQNEVPEEANLAAASMMKENGGRVLLNAAPARPVSPSLASLVDVLVVNALEAEVLAPGAPVHDLDGAKAAARRLSKDYPCAVVTAGGAGVASAARDAEEIALEAIRVKVESTHGAGDAFIGHLAASLANGDSMRDALSRANRAAALLVGTPETGRQSPSA